MLAHRRTNRSIGSFTATLLVPVGSNFRRYYHEFHMSASDNDYLYRIVDFSRALDLFDSRQLHFSAPSEWDDPFETILYHRRSHALFAQCWCKKSVSDAMWRVYSPKHQSVRLRTTRWKLEAVARQYNDENLSSWIRDVDYRAPSQVRAALTQLTQRLRETYTIAEAVDALFLKRDAFDYENEVRVVLHDTHASTSSPPAKFLRLNVDPHYLIESIMFDPQVDPYFYRSSKLHLQTVTGFKGSIGQSALYRLQRRLIIE